MNTTIDTFNSKRVMIDIETIGVGAGAGILSIGATTFDISKTFYSTIDPADARLYFREDIETLRWWNTKVPFKIKEEAFSGTLTTAEVLNTFFAWLSSIGSKDEVEVWAKGTYFDIAMLEWAYKRFDIAIPWDFRKVMDYRTLANLFPHVKAGSTSKAHIALDDAVIQANHAVDLLNML